MMGMGWAAKEFHTVLFPKVSRLYTVISRKTSQRRDMNKNIKTSCYKSSHTLTVHPSLEITAIFCKVYFDL